MTSVYNLLREACGISQLEAAENVHGTRLDTVKSWSSNRRPAPEWAINQLQSLSRRIRRAGADYAALIKQTSKGNVFIIGLSHDDHDARLCGFPSTAAQLQATAVAISLLPDDSAIRLVAREPGAIPAPVLEQEQMAATNTDRKVLLSMSFDKDGRFFTSGNINRRKYERLEQIGWVKGIATNASDVVYYITGEGKEAYKIKPGDLFRMPHPRNGAESLFRTHTVRDDSITLTAEGDLRRYQALACDIRHLWTPDANLSVLT